MKGFSLVEVVLALGICSFALVGIMALFVSGLKTNRESEEMIQAANLVSVILNTRQAAPFKDIVNFPVPHTALTNTFVQLYGADSSVKYLGADGRLTDRDHALYRITCWAGTNYVTGPHLAQVYLMVSWPIGANSSNPSAGRYELTSYVRLQ